MMKGVYIVEVKNKAMNREQRRSIERSNMRSLKGKKVQATNKSEKISEIKRKTTKISFITSIAIGLLFCMVYLYIKR